MSNEQKKLPFHKVDYMYAALFFCNFVFFRKGKNNWTMIQEKLAKVFLSLTTNNFHYGENQKFDIQESKRVML